jgi:hypothetical protein
MVEMCYVITDGKYFINSSGGQHVVNSLNQATKMKREKAENVLKCLPKILKKYEWSIEYGEVERGEIITIPQPKEINYDILNKVLEIETFAKDLKERNQYLKARLSHVELEIVDIEHAAEFYVLNASQGYKIYKMLHEAKIERRNIKNEMEKIKYILSSSMNSALYNKVSKTIIGVDNKQYSPRVLKELFGA